MKAKNMKERKREEKERKEKDPVWLIFQRPDLADGSRNPAKFARWMSTRARIGRYLLKRKPSAKNLLESYGSISRYDIRCTLPRGGALSRLRPQCELK